MSADRNKAFAVGALLGLTLALGGCSSTSISDLPGGYLPVHDVPPDRAEPELAPADRAKIQAELAAARDRQASAAAAQNSAPK
jgi:hypothetical protein